MKSNKRKENKQKNYCPLFAARLLIVSMLHSNINTYITNEIIFSTSLVSTLLLFIAAPT